MDFSLIHSIWTVLVLVIFVGIVVWAWSAKRKGDFDRAANIPFDDDGASNGDNPSQEKEHG